MALPLDTLLADARLPPPAGAEEAVVTGVTADSRRAGPGSLFAAVPGLTVDGHDYIDRAVAAGAVAVLAEAGRTAPRPGVGWVEVDDVAAALGPLAAAFHGHPSAELALVGITGTNGKTTVATLCDDLFTALGYRCGLVGTVEVRIGGEARPATHTTPDAVAVQALLREMADAGCGYVFMEVSSHALAQGRVGGCRFAGAAFTNLSHDHLDYHGGMPAYIEAKKLLFDGLGDGAFALVNADDKRGAVMLQNTAARRLRYALKRPAEYKGRIREESLRGLLLDVDGREVYTRLAGAFNAYNLLCAYGIARELGQDRDEALATLSALRGAAGRLETVTAPGTRLTGIVDYAHTPDAVRNLLRALRAERRRGNRVIAVLGCGGDRDRAKRPEMAAAAAALSDRVIVTDDNPRSEDPAAIRAAMLAGLDDEARARALEIADRREAIRAAVALARDEDVVVVAGKGHETYQEVAGVRTPFDDRAVLRECLTAAAPRAAG